jgi:NADH dehydrogenase FAD-containing subunit
MHFYLGISILQNVGISSKFVITIKKKIFYDTLIVACCSNPVTFGILWPTKYCYMSQVTLDWILDWRFSLYQQTSLQHDSTETSAV